MAPNLKTKKLSRRRRLAIFGRGKSVISDGGLQAKLQWHQKWWRSIPKAAYGERKDRRLCSTKSWKCSPGSGFSRAPKKNAVI